MFLRRYRNGYWRDLCRRSSLGFPAVCLFCAVFSISVVAVQTQNTRSTSTGPKADWGPTTTYEKASGVDSPHRSSRASKYDNLAGSGDPITKDSVLPSVFDLPVTHMRKDNLPVQKSDAIMVGIVTAGRAYLSNDKKSIYSEFDFKIRETLKTSANISLSVGSSIEIERFGGQILFPSGKVITRGRANEPLPVSGGRYVVFLRYNESGEDFSIITMYRLVGAHVYWLDGARDPDHDKSLPEVTGKDTTHFLSDLRTLIATQPSDGGML